MSEANWQSFVLAMLLGMLVGWQWYAPVLGERRSPGRFLRMNHQKRVIDSAIGLGIAVLVALAVYAAHQAGWLAP